MSKIQPEKVKVYLFELGSIYRAANAITFAPSMTRLMKRNELTALVEKYAYLCTCLSVPKAILGSDCFGYYEILMRHINLIVTAKYCTSLEVSCVQLGTKYALLKILLGEQLDSSNIELKEFAIYGTRETLTQLGYDKHKIDAIACKLSSFKHPSDSPRLRAILLESIEKSPLWKTKYSIDQTHSSALAGISGGDFNGANIAHLEVVQHKYIAGKKSLRPDFLIEETFKIDKDNRAPDVRIDRKSTSRQYTDEVLLDSVSLSSQRIINQVNLSGTTHPCRTIHAYPDGNCGFISTQLFLELHGKSKMAHYFTRDNYKSLVLRQWNRADLSSGERELIRDLFVRDKAATSGEWPDLFGGRWVEEVDLKFLSRHFNIKFLIFCEMDGVFKPEPSYEVIYFGTSLDYLTEVSLAHVSTQLKSRDGASLNHYDALVINPTPAQVVEIDAMNVETNLRNVSMTKKQTAQATANLPQPVSSGDADERTPHNDPQRSGSQLPLLADLPKIHVDNRPNEMVYAFLSQLVYAANTLTKNQDLSTIPGLEGWRAKKIYSGGRHYEGVLFTCAETRSAVLAHKGTDSAASLWEDFEGIFRNKTTSSQRETIFDFVRTSLDYCEEEDYQLSFTGHSLGAFLAELSVYYCHRSLQLTTTHAVTFESPGCLESLNSLQANLTQGQVDLDLLDIMGYVSYPNLVNTCNHHVGTLCSVKPGVGTPSNWVPRWLNISHLIRIHTISNFIDVFKDPDWSNKVSYMSDWPLGNQHNYFFKHATLTDGVYDLSQTDINKQEFVLDYEGHYTVLEGLTPKNSLPLIHFNPTLRGWLDQFYHNLKLVQHRDGKEAVTEHLKELANEKGIDEIVLLYLLAGHIVLSNKTPVFVQIVDRNGLSPSIIRQELSAWISKHPRQAGELLTFGGAISSQKRQGCIRAELIAEGGELTETGLIENSRVLGSLFSVTEETSDEEIKHLKELNEHFFKTVARSGVSVIAVGIAKGAKMAGTIRNLTVAASAFEVRGRSKEGSRRLGNLSQAEQMGRQRERDGLHQQSPKEGGGAGKDDTEVMEPAPKSPGN